ncbi:hypothetical protein [Hoeflea sp.]|uniref:hypothetical protein n=1 Tax=Hoeflea sp. TaxID=1940281 RepID=UPI0019A2BDB8|nr:hypothetical protein [Hoeflea sp.]MBC7281518.1 hypothetical protein [Hoeflea sp.]
MRQFVAQALRSRAAALLSTSTLFEQTIDSLRNEGKSVADKGGGSRSLFASDGRSGFTGAQV